MPAQLKTTYTLMEKTLVIYRRERSSVWQCRYKVDGTWQRASTKETQLGKAKEVAKRILIEAEIRKQSNLPVVTRKFRDVAKLAIKRMEEELTNGTGKVSYKDYIRVTNEYLIPILGKRNITSIDVAALDELDAKRIEMMGKAPSQSTLLTQNAALNRVFDEAVIHNFLTEANRPKLDAKGRKSDRRPAFELDELQAVLGNFAAWIERARNEHSKEMRQIMRDYVEMLVDTGARPGVELLELKWKQIRPQIKPVLLPTSKIVNDEYGEDEETETVLEMNRTVEMTVSGKTGTRDIIGRQPTVDALKRIAQRNYSVEMSVLEPLKNVATAQNNDYVLRTKEKQDVSSSFQKMLERYLEEHSLLLDAKKEHKRVFYSFRHTYATLALTHDKVPIHTLAQQMGTSVLMIERHYSHLKVIQAIEQLRGEESRRLIAAGTTVNQMYAPAKKSKKTKTNKTSKTKV